jgi:hypothetical protein
MSRPRARSAWLRTARSPAAVPAWLAAPVFRYECSFWYRIWNHPIHWRSLLHRAGIVIAVLGAIGLIAHFGGDFVSAAGEWVERLGP